MSKLYKRGLVVGILAMTLILGQGAWRGLQADEKNAVPEPWSLNKCLEMALAGQTDLLVARRSLEAATARNTQARSAYYPQVAVRADADVAGSGSALKNDDGIFLTVTQNIYDGGLREARNAGAGYALQASEAALEQAGKMTVLNVTKAYLNLLRARRVAELAGQRVAFIDGQSKLVEARVEAGDAPKADLLPVKAQLANAVVDQLADRNSARTAAIRLQLAIGLTPASTFDIQEMDIPEQAVVSSLDEALAAAQKNRPEIRRTRAVVGSAEAIARTARIGLGLQPVVSGRFEQPVSGDDSSDFSVTAGISFNIFDGQKSRAAYQEAQANLSSAELEAGQIVKDITADVQEAYLAMTNARERMSAGELSRQASQNNFDAQQERYKQGLAIPLELLNAQLELSTAENNAIEAKYDYMVSLADMKYAMGEEGGLL